MNNNQNYEYDQERETENTNKSAIVTGANSGIGFETSAALAEAGYAKVVLATRSVEKGELAKELLVERTGKDVFEIIAMDMSEKAEIDSAVMELSQRGSPFDLIILNAGMVPSKRSLNSDGVELTLASTLIGHHILTMGLLDKGMVSKNARIVIAGSEGARGDAPGITPLDFREFAKEHFDGDLVKAMIAFGRYDEDFKFKTMNIYATAKVMTVWWAAVLSSKLPKGMTVNAISPGNIATTGFTRNLGFVMRKVMPAVAKTLGKLMGMTHSIEKGAERYLTGAQFDDKTTGLFFASPKKKLAGKLHLQEYDHFSDTEFQKAGWETIVEISNGIDYPKLEKKVATGK